MARMKLFSRPAKKAAAPVKAAPTKKAEKEPRQAGPGSRGWTGRGGGMAQLVPSVREYRGTTVQVCGLWPFSSGASSPMIGVPLGRHEETQATVCCDPISWFQRARLISNPSAFILGKPGPGEVHRGAPDVHRPLRPGRPPPDPRGPQRRTRQSRQGHSADRSSSSAAASAT